MGLRTVVFGFFFLLILTSCANSTAGGSETQTGIENTMAPREQETQVPETTPTRRVTSPTLRPVRRETATTSPSRTPRTSTPSPSVTTTETLEDLRADFVELIIDYLEQGGGSNEIQSVRRVGFSQGGFFDIELETMWPSRDLQPSVAFEVIYWLGRAWMNSPEELFYRLSGQNRFVVRLVTYSSEGRFAYRSETDLAAVQQVGELEMVYEEWLEASNAGFRP